MACGVVLRRNKVIFSAHYISRAHNLGHGHITEVRAFTSFRHDHNHDNACGLLKLGLIRRSCCGNIINGNGNYKLEFTRTASQFVRFASTITNTKPKLVLNHDKCNGEELADKKIVEKENLGIDQAIEGSSSTKANRWQESYNVASEVLFRIWGTISGIGPNLRAVAAMSRYDWVLIFEDWKDEFHHLRGIYLDRYELMFSAAKITLRLLVKISRGKRLSKRERQLLTQSTADLFSLIPVSMLTFVKFIEFMLPVFLKLFPSMIPPTSQDTMIEKEALKRKVKGLKARSEFAVFLQDTARAMIKLNVKQTACDHDHFMSTPRMKEPSNEDIFLFARLYNDELTLDNISIAQLVNMCNCMGIPPCGTDEYLRLMLRKRLKMIKKEDKLINAKGVESLSEAELHKYCRERGIHLVEEMRQQLYDWLDLSLNHHIPSSLLILSRTFAMTGKSKPEEAILATIDSFPYELACVASARSLPCPDTAYDKIRRDATLRTQKTIIKEEKRREKVISEMKQSDATQDDLALEEMIIPVAYAATEQAKQAKASVGDKQEKLSEISYANAAFATALPVITECEKFLMLVKNEINLINSVHDIEGEYDKIIAMKADRAACEENEQDAVLCTGDEVSLVLAKRADAMLQNLDKEIDDVDAEIGYRWRGLDRYCDGTISPEVVAAASLYLKDALGKEGIQKLISNISKHNGVEMSRETLITCSCVGIVPYRGFRGGGCDVFCTGRCRYLITDDTSKN